MIPWPVFLSFLKEEENFYKSLLCKLDTSNLPKKNLDIILNHKEDVSVNNINLESSNEIKNDSLYWFINHESSCRYDSFLFIFFFKLKDYINNINVNLNNNIQNLLDLCEKIQLNDTFLFLRGIWKFFEKNKEISNNTLNEDFGYKAEYHIQSIYTWFSNCELFSFNYKEISDCIICKSHN